MEPLHIRFTFRSPVMVTTDHPIHLDALIAYGVMCDLRDMGSSDAFRESDDLSAYLEKQAWGESWVWKASRLYFAPASSREWVNMVRSSRNVVYYAALASGAVTGKPPKCIQSGSGVLRGYQWLSATQWMTHANAWAVGDRDAVLDVLTRRVAFIGKKGASGYGTIKSITVEPAPDTDRERWMLRTLPASAPTEAGSYARVSATTRPPYWRRDAREDAWEPTL